MNDDQLLALQVSAEVDCEGEVCPGPVLKSMEALGAAQSGEIVVLRTDLQVATENVKIAVETGGLAEVLGVRHAEGIYAMYMRKV